MQENMQVIRIKIYIQRPHISSLNTVYDIGGAMMMKLRTWWEQNKVLTIIGDAGTR